MKLRVLRVNYTDTYTQGEAYVYKNGQDVFSCYTIENPWLDNEPYVSCIPTGTYKAFRRTSPSNGEVIELKDVPNRTFIQFHVANFPEDVEGCIGVGLSKEDGAVYESKKAMNEILGFAGDDITVQIWDIPDITPDRVETRSIDPAVFEWDTSFPADYIDEVDEGKGLQRAKEIAEEQLSKSKWKDRARVIFNTGISILSRVTTIPELNELKLKTKRSDTMSNIDVSKKIQKIINADGWEALVWAAIAVGGVVSGYTTGEVSYIAGGLAAGVKSTFQWYKSKKDSEEE